MAITIRQATLADAETIAELLGQLGYPHTRAQTVDMLQQIFDWPGQEVRVAEQQRRVVAVMLLSQCPALGEQQYGEIRSLVTDNRYRGQGVGGLMIADAERWTAAAGLDRLRVRCNRVRDDAHRFYRQAGFSEQKQQLVFEKSL
ncbi:MAG: GNAT family N-acetyltransferase [Halopseudomonas sp.]